VRVREFIDQARFAYARLADDRGDLSATAAGALLHQTKSLQLSIAADEARQATPGARLKPCARWTSPRDLEDLDGLAQPLDVDGAQRLDLDEALGESQGLRADRRIEPAIAVCSMRAAR
jgi:hypothetical protein